MLAADFDERLGLITLLEGDCSARRPKHNPPCRVAVGGLANGSRSKGEFVGLLASVGHGAQNGEKKVVSSKVPRNMDEIE